MTVGGDTSDGGTSSETPDRTQIPSAPFPYHILNRRGEIQSVNDAWLDCLGYEREAVEGVSFADFLPERGRIRFEAIRETIQEDGTGEGTFHVRQADGQLLQIEYRGRAVVDETEDIERFHGQFLSNTNVHEQKIQLEKAQDVANIGRWSKSIPSDHISWSDRVYDIWGVEGGSGPIDHESFMQRVYPEDRERVEAAWQEAKEGAPYDIEHRIVTEEGEVKWVREKAELEFDESGDPFRATGIVQDITDRKEREQAHLERGEKYETLVESSRDGITVIQEGKLVMANERFASMLGYPDPNAVEGEPVTDYVAPADRDLVMDRYRARLNGGDPPSRYEIDALREDGRTIPVELNVSVITYDGFPADLAIVRDISEQREREQDLRRFKNAVEAAGQAIVITDTDGTIEYVNPAFEEITGYSKNEAVGQNPRMLKSGEMSRAFYADMWETITDGETWTGEFTNRRKNGDLYHVNQTIAPITDEEGTIEAFATVQTDISERVERENRLAIQTERLDLALDGANLAVWDWDMQTDEVYLDDRFARMLGYDPESVRTHGTGWKDLIAPADEPAYESALEAHVSGEQKYLDAEYRLRTEAGEWKWIRNLGKIVERAEDGTPKRAVGIHQDVDERKRTKQALEENNELLRAIDRVLRHNINNDMNVIKGFAETIRSEASDPLETQAERIVRSSEKLLETTDKERRITKLLSEDDGPEPVDLGAVIEQSVAQHRKRYPDASVEMTVPDTATVTAIQQIDQAVDELLENATIHSDQDEPNIRVTLEENADSVALQVADNGPGIPEMERQVLMDETEITPLYHGSGLGLWFVNLVVNRSEGELHFAERETGGSSVTIRFPRH